MTANIPEVGEYRPAHRVREGWQIRFVDDETGAKSWETVTAILRVYSPANFVRFTFGELGAASAAHDTDVFCRNKSEITKAATR